MDVTTFHNDVARTGQNLSETTLTPANVNSSSFGKVGFLSVDGKVDAQPLYLSNVPIGGQNHNVVFVATEHASAYAFDADSGTQLWKVSTLGSGETPSDDQGCYQLTPEIGITATPVIDRKHGPNGTIYIVAMSKDASGGYHQRFHALDVTTGAELAGSPKEIQAAYPGTGQNSSAGTVTFDPKKYAERAALLLLNGSIYTGWTSHCDSSPYTGWIMGFDASTLGQTSVLNFTPNGSGGSIWMSGGGLAADGSGNIFLINANGTFDTTLNANGFPGQGDYGNCFFRLSPANGRLSVADYFSPFDTVSQSNEDNDLGSGGVLLLPDLIDSAGQTRRLAVGGGKTSILYVVDRDSMGKFNPSRNNVYEELSKAVAGPIFSTPAYYNNTVYIGAVGDSIKAFNIGNAQLPQQASNATPNTFPYPGATPSISANGNTNGIVWAAENGSTAALHAYNASDISQELYNSKQAGSRDSFGEGNKFIAPMIANGKVYVGTTNGVAVFGLLH